MKKTEKYSNTVLEPLFRLKSTLPHRDATFVSLQNQRWTIKELDVIK